MSNIDAFKLVLVGGSNVGKTSVIRRYVEESFSAKARATMTASYSEKIVNVQGSRDPIKL